MFNIYLGASCAHVDRCLVGRKDKRELENEKGDFRKMNV